MNRLGTIFGVRFKYKHWDVSAKGYGVDEEGATKVVLRVANGLRDKPTKEELGTMHQEAWMMILDKYTEAKDDLDNVSERMHEV